MQRTRENETRRQPERPKAKHHGMGRHSADQQGNRRAGGHDRAGGKELLPRNLRRVRRREPATADHPNSTEGTMTDAPLIIIPRKHQSSPKEHWSEKELRLAAEEIDNGQFQVPQDPNEF